MATGLDLGKQVGPLPMGGWLVVIAGGLGVGYVINKNMAKNNAASEDDPTQLTESGTGGGGGQFIYTPPSTGGQDTAPETNATWGTKAKNWLIAPPQSIAPSTADNAIRKYLSGQSLSVSERAIVDLALVRFGVPPDFIPPFEDDEPEPEEPANLPAVSNLHVNRAQLRNDVRWDYDTAETGATHFIVSARALTTGLQTGGTVPAIPGKNAYDWLHQTWPIVTTPSPVEYTVTPYKGASAGQPAKVTATHLV
jgi:hypothetical protein